MTIYVIFLKTLANDVLPIGYYEDSADADKHVAAIKASSHWTELKDKLNIYDVYKDTMDVVSSSTKTK